MGWRKPARANWSSFVVRASARIFFPGGGYGLKPALRTGPRAGDSAAHGTPLDSPKANPHLRTQCGVTMTTFQRFTDRYDAGRALAARLTAYRGRAWLLVLALPRGGVPVGYEVARALGGELDVFLVRKLGAPGQEELAMGAIASGGVRVLNEHVLRVL